MRPAHVQDTASRVLAAIARDVQAGLASSSNAAGSATSWNSASTLWYLLSRHWTSRTLSRLPASIDSTIGIADHRMYDLRRGHRERRQALRESVSGPISSFQVIV